MGRSSRRSPPRRRTTPRLIVSLWGTARWRSHDPPADSLTEGAVPLYPTPCHIRQRQDRNTSSGHINFTGRDDVHEGGYWPEWPGVGFFRRDDGDHETAFHRAFVARRFLIILVSELIHVPPETDFIASPHLPHPPSSPPATRLVSSTINKSDGSCLSTQPLTTRSTCRGSSSRLSILFDPRIGPACYTFQFLNPKLFVFFKLIVQGAQ